MEPLPPRHRHGRNHHSAARNAFASSTSPSFSLEGPYDDVSLSKGGKKSKFGVHEYAEIFAGSSSIPVLDLSILDERAGSGDLRSSRLDYSNIFGGLRNDEVAVPYDELLSNAAARKTKTQIPNDAPSRPESDSLNSPGKTRKSSDEASDKSIDGMKQQFNISFNKISQINNDDSNGKTHIAQLHAVPAFTHFVDAAPQLQKKGGGSDMPTSSLKREVSRTWSFNVGVNNGPTCATVHGPDKPVNSNEINLKQCVTEVPPPTSQPCNPTGENDPRGLESPSFNSDDVFKRIDGENPLPCFDEELDENSVAAVSAAALKKAIEQAQESIRIARMIMERQKENLQGGSKPRSMDKNRSGIDSVADISMENNKCDSYKRIDTLPMFTGINAKIAPSLKHTGRFLHAGRADVDRVNLKVETEIGHGNASMDVGKKFAAACSRSETCYSAEIEKFALEDVGTAEGCWEAITSTRLGGANAECCSDALELGKVNSYDKLLNSPDKLQSQLEEMETVTRHLEQLSSHQMETNKTIAELAETDLSTSDSAQGIGMGADNASVQIQETGDTVKVAEVIVESSEKVLHSSESVREQEMIANDIVENLCIMKKEEVMGERDDASDIKLNKEKKFVEHFTAHKFDFNDLMSGLRCLAEKDMLGMKGMENPVGTYPEWKGNGQHGKQSDQEKNKVMHQEVHPCFESTQQLKNSLDVEISDREPENLPVLGVDPRNISVLDQPEMDGKKGHIECDRDECQSSRKDEQCVTVEWCMNTSEFEAAETTEIEHRSEVAWGAEEPTSGHGAETREQKGDKFDLHDATCEEDICACDKAVGIINSDARTNDSNISSVIQESCELIDKAEEYLAAAKGCDEDGSLTGVGKLFHQEVNEMQGTEHNLRRCASEENFIGSKLIGTFEGFSSDSSAENASLVHEGNDENLPRPEDLFKAASKIHGVEEEADEIVLEDFPDFCPNSKAAEFDHRNVMELGQTSQSIKRSVSSSVLEEINGGSCLESQECAEDEEDNTSNKEEVKHEFDMTPDGRDSVEEHKEQLCCETEMVFSLPNGDAIEVNNSMENKREDEPVKSMETNEGNTSGPSTIKPKDARGKWEKVEENDRQQRIEAIKKGREREKDRKAVERAIREARERAFAEAREKAERAAVERAAAEVRQRVLAEAQEKLEKASMDSKLSTDKLYTEAKIRAERAAVERATAEARERALEKAMSQKTYKDSRTQAEKYSTERLSSSSRDKGLKHSFSSSDLEKFDETTSESAQRRKARLERHQRIMERAAKALAEKNKRDLLAQKEQAEKNRLAETLDAEIKRWAGGKEGNLRALLSTLQYILGADSGWQPTSLTEIITTAAVRKAYRRATLCVHPDKLQQRGASIQQKYICEKVFDLLKAAWNRFNSEEN